MSSTGADGQLKASAALARTMLRPDVRRVIDDYARLETDEARAHFADHFLGRTAHAMDEIWPVFYELLKRVKDEQLYARPGYLSGDRIFESFAEYFEHRVGRPFDTWAQLEGTYHYARKYAPDLLRKAFSIARDAKERATRGAQQIAQAVKDGLTINAGTGRPTKEEVSNDDIIINRSDTGLGTSAVYLTRRIARDHGEPGGILDRMCAGEYPSIRAAAIDAGIAPRTQTIRVDDPESIARTLRKHLSAETLTRLIELLTDDESPQGRP